MLRKSLRISAGEPSFFYLMLAQSCFRRAVGTHHPKASGTLRKIGRNYLANANGSHRCSSPIIGKLDNDRGRHDGDDRLVLDHGASGAPVLACKGRAVAVVHNLLTRTLQFLSKAIHVSTPWQTPNVVCVRFRPSRTSHE
jgi:hypothetical protein